MNKCKWFGHKWIPVFFNGIITNTQPVKFIGCYCTRCYKGYKELLNFDKIFTKKEYITYSEKYFNNPII